MNFKKLVVAAAMLTAATGANAAWFDGVGPNNTREDGELILTVWNADVKRALSIDLGGFVSDYVKGTAVTNEFALSASDVAWLGNSSNIFWNVAGVSSTRVSASDWTGNGIYFTMADGASTTGVGGSFSTANWDAKKGLFQTYATYPSIPGLNDDETGVRSANNTYRSEGDLYAGSGLWGEGIGGVVFQVSGSEDDGFAAANEIMRAFKATWTPSVNNGVGNSVAIESDRYWQLDLANNKLVYATNPAEVPVPAAAWLFGSALLGLAGAVRRRRSV
jgi:hypothetical protein